MVSLSLLAPEIIMCLGWLGRMLHIRQVWSLVFYLHFAWTIDHLDARWQRMTKALHCSKFHLLGMFLLASV